LHYIKCKTIFHTLLLLLTRELKTAHSHVMPRSATV